MFRTAVSVMARGAKSGARRFQSGTTFFFEDRYALLDAQPNKAALYSYNSALVAAASCDGMDERERKYVVGLGALHGLTEDEVTRNLKQEWSDAKIEATIRAFCESIQDEHWKGYLLYDCVKACSADQFYSPEERAKVRKIASIMNLTDGYVANIENFVIREQQLKEKGKEIMRGEDA